MRSIVDRTKNRFNVAVAEVAELDTWRRAVLGATVVSNDASHANSMLDKIADFMSTAGDAVVVDRATELISIGDMGHAGADGDMGWGGS